MNKRPLIIAVASVLFFVVIATGLFVAYDSIEYPIRQAPSQQLIPRPSNSATTDEGTTGDAPRLVGVWNTTDATDANGAIAHSFEFRADGTFAERAFGRLQDYTEKCNMDTGWCSGPEYPASATSTGLWSLASLSNLSQELVAGYGPKPVPVSKMMTASPPLGTIILKLAKGNENPDYLGVLLTNDGNLLDLFYLFGDTSPLGQYVKMAP